MSLLTMYRITNTYNILEVAVSLIKAEYVVSGQRPIIMSFINIKIKVRCENTEQIEKVLLQRQAKYTGTDHQRNTDFRMRHL